MDIKNNLCEAFCGMLSVTEVPTGFAVGTGHEGFNGDHIGFYVIGPDASGQYFIQDDGLTMATLEAMGVDLANKSRKGIFSELRDQYAVSFDRESGELKSASVKVSELGAIAMRFMAFMLRVQDLLLTTNERVVSTFKQEAIKIISELTLGRAEVIPDFVVAPKVAEYPADIGIIVPNHRPIALFFGVSEVRILEALLLQANAEKFHIDCAVMALLETEESVSKKTRARANNHLTAVPNFREDEYAACARIVREVFET